MKAVILAAGYATRLYPLTENFPKPLLQVGNQTILDRLIAQLAEIQDIDQAVVVTNHKFASHFESWRRSCTLPIHVELLDDGSTQNDDRLGAVGDIQLAIERFELEDDLFVAAADNILLFDLGDFVRDFKVRCEPLVCARYVESIEARQRTGIVVLDDENRILQFQEKPKEPASPWGVPPLYVYPKKTLSLFQRYLADGQNPDAPGNFIEWLSTREAVYAWKMNGTVLDIGNLQSLEAARARFAALD